MLWLTASLKLCLLWQIEDLFIWRANPS
uniref:Uncharacterized protein n=1 Tax=Anguilla anguilla TaxID=7936 RepID=A0A0E9RNE3_ANGAN